MVIALLGACNTFSVLQHALSSLHNTNHIALKREVHDTLNDFQWLSHDIYHCSTRIAELVLLTPSTLGYHNALGTSADEVWYLTLELCPWHGVT